MVATSVLLTGVVNRKCKMSHKNIGSTSIESDKNNELNVDEVEVELDGRRDVLFTDYNK